MSKNKYLIIIEYAKGSDKGCDGFRPDTKPILNAFVKEAGYEGEVVFYNHKRKDDLFKYIKSKATLVLSRINPGNLKEVDEYLQFLKKLADSKIEVSTHPDVMMKLNFKDILVSLRNKVIGDKRTFFYTNTDDFRKLFPKALKKEKIRVLKRNYGSTGEGIFLVRLNENGTIISTEAVNNTKYKFENLDQFLDDFETKFEIEDKNAVFFKGKSGFVDCKYLSRIDEGEIRVLLVKDKIVSIVHKKPKEGEFSATLFSGATYEYDKPDNIKWESIVKLSNKALKDLKVELGTLDFPVLWTMDFILDFDKNKNNRPVLSEINCSCVGITTQLELASNIAKAYK